MNLFHCSSSSVKCGRLSPPPPSESIYFLQRDRETGKVRQPTVQETLITIIVHYGLEFFCYCFQCLSFQTKSLPFFKAHIWFFRLILLGFYRVCTGANAAHNKKAFSPVNSRCQAAVQSVDFEIESWLSAVRWWWFFAGIYLRWNLPTDQNRKLILIILCRCCLLILISAAAAAEFLRWKWRAFQFDRL